MYISLTFINFISTGQLKKDRIEYNIYKDYFVIKINDQDIATITWIANVLILSVQDVPVDKHLVQINLDYIMPKIIYKILYNRLMYIGPEGVLKVAKDAKIFIS